MYRCVRIPGVELGDDHHTLPPVFFLALPTVLGPLLRLLLPGHLHQSSDEQCTTEDDSPLSGQTGKHLVPLNLTGSDGHSEAFTPLAIGLRCYGASGEEIAPSSPQQSDG